MSARLPSAVSGGALAFLLVLAQPVLGAETAPPKTTEAPAPKTAEAPPEGTMTLAHMDEIVHRLDKEAAREGGVWKFKIEGVFTMIVTDEAHNRMRILVPIRKIDGLDAAMLMRLMQADFDSALDARYAIAQGILWGAFIHPLAALRDGEFISGIGQTVNLALTYGSSYSSGELVYGGGDSGDILRRALIDELLKKGRGA